MDNIKIISFQLYKLIYFLDFNQIQKQFNIFEFQQSAMLSTYNYLQTTHKHINKYFLMHSEEQTQKVKIISLFDKQRNKEDRYMLSLQTIGQGKYGKVYKAVNVDKPNVIFAVKVIKLCSQKVKDECKKQLQIIQHLPNCLNLVKIHPQHIQSQNNFYIFEEYCDGGNLYEEKVSKKNNPFTQDEIFNIFYQVTSGFLELRKAGIFHEDIKPQNILKKNNLYKITDFGISQLDRPQQSSTIRKGTLIYMPPQKLKNAEYTPTSKSQIFSLGVTFYEVFFGHPPFLVKKPANYRQYLKLITEAKIKSVDELKQSYRNPSLMLDKLIRMILKMINLNESKRLSLQELIDYIKTSEPFVSMKISQNMQDQKNKQIFSNKKKYETVAQSNIFVSISDSASISKTFNVKEDEDFEAIVEALRLHIQFFKNASSYLQQGINYCNETNLYDLTKKSCTYKKFPFNSKSQYLELLTFFYVDWAFSEVTKKCSSILMTLPIQEEVMIDFQISLAKDCDFVKNQFFKIYTGLEVQNKKQMVQELKDEGFRVGEKLIGDFKNIFREIDCIRINFKEDILALFFLKSVSQVLEYFVNNVNLFIGDCNKNELFKNLGKENYDICKKIMKDFSRYQATQRSKLQKQVQQQMNKIGKQILYDIESNSDQFEVLEFEDY